MQWGSRDWFLNKFESQGVDQPGAYFAHRSNGYQRLRHRRLVGYLREGAGGPLTGRLLDVGCGAGELTERIFRNNAFSEGIGLDFVAPAVELARNRFPAIDFRLGSLPRLDFEDNGFQLVIASEVIYYLSDPDRRLAVDEIRRVLRPGGWFFFTSVLGDGYFTPEQAMDLLENRLLIEKVWLDDHRAYHRLTSPLTALNSLYFTIYGGNRPIDPEVGARVEKWRRRLDHPLARTLLRAAQVATNPILSSESLPRLLSPGRGASSPGRATNIAVLGRKPAAE